jgi:hypothetical protein
MPLRGALRELVVSRSGHVAALQAESASALVLLMADERRSCMVDAGAPQAAGGTVFGGLAINGRRLSWHRGGVELAQTIEPLTCPGD